MKKKYYLVLDTETATLPFADEIAETTKQKQNIAIAKPLVYDIGWLIMDRQGNILTKKNYLVQETFFVPNIFNTAYYKEKRPIYMEMYNKKEIEAKPWNDIIEILLEDLRKVDFVCAYNAAFDFKKAIPFTERYIKALYSTHYNEWEKRQFQKCEEIAFGKNDDKNETFLEPIFELRNEEFDIADLWGLSCEKLTNTNKYRDFCLENDLITNSGIYFKSSAESVYQYLKKDKDFIEDHTALSDCMIEAEILLKILKKGKIEPTIKAFPFRNLGTTYEYVSEKTKHIEKVIEVLKLYLKSVEKSSNFTSRIENILGELIRISLVGE
jgi:DNA polymerase III epsilon subunit-like protein